MKKVIYLLLAACLLVLASCATNSNGAEKNVLSQPLPPADGLEFPAAALRINAGDTVYAMVSSSIISNYDPLPPVELFNNPVVTLCTLDYYYKGEHITDDYEMIYTGVNGICTDGLVEYRDEIGIATRDGVNVIVRTKDLHPYFLCSSPVYPVEYNGYWYFYPVTVDSRLPKWLSFAPADYESFRWMYNHTCVPESAEADDEWAPGMSYFDWSFYMTTALTEYPAVIEGSGVTQGVQVDYEQVIDWNGFKLHLYYQPGFLGYLENEYTLGEPIVLYLNIDSISFFGQEFNCYVRDFAFKTPDEMVESLTKKILDKQSEK